MKGLVCYFDKALPAMLLYKSERQQFEELIINDVSPSSIYGAEHLLRLFGNTFSFVLNFHPIVHNIMCERLVVTSQRT